LEGKHNSTSLNFPLELVIKKENEHIPK